MKILHVLHELKFSGAEIMYVDAAPEFRELGCSLSVMATAENLGEYAPYFEKSGYSVYHRPFPFKSGFRKKLEYLKECRIYFKRSDFDVIHIHSSVMMYSMALVARLCGIKSVYTFHNVFPTSFYSYPWHLFKRWSAKYLLGCTFQTISQSVCNHERKLYLNKTSLVYNWYGYKRFYPASSEEKLKIRNELQIAPNATVLISIGGCSHIKRHSHIIKTLPNIAAKYPDLVYLHLGNGCTLLEEIELTKTLGVEKYVRFCGNIEEVRQYLIASDIYLMPSKFEGIPITTIEAMGCMIPCILYNVPGLRDFNNENENALIIEADYEILADSIIQLIIDKNMARQLSEKAKKFVDHRFSLKQNVRQIFNLYKS